jgi:hypothetical protein
VDRYRSCWLPTDSCSIISASASCSLSSGESAMAPLSLVSTVMAGVRRSFNPVASRASAWGVNSQVALRLLTSY